MERRIFLCAALGAGALALIPKSMARRAGIPADPGDVAKALAMRTEDEVIRALFGNSPAGQPGRLTLEVPRISDTADIPVAVTFPSSGTEFVAIVAPASRFPLRAIVTPGPGVSRFRSRVRLGSGTSMSVRAYASVSGTLVRASAEVKTSVGGYGMTSPARAASVTPRRTYPETRVKARHVQGRTEVIALLGEPPAGEAPETDDLTRQFHFSSNGRPLGSVELGRSAAAGVIVGITVVEGRPGNRILLRWSDSRGHSDVAETIVIGQEGRP